MNFIKKNINKFIIGLSLCLVCLFSFFISNNTYALDENDNSYEILPNQIKSKNLFGGSISVYGGVFSGGNFVGNVSSNTSASYYVYRRDNGSNVSLQTQSNNGRYNITFQKYSYSTALSLWAVGNVNDQYIMLDISNFENGYYTLSATFNKNTISRVSINEIMLVKGSTALSYFPYGSFNGINDYDWNEDLLEENEILNQIPKNYFTYIIGNNYFNNSNFTFSQRLSNFSGSLRLASAPLDTPNTFIEGNKLYLSQLFNYSFNNSKSLDNNLNYVNVYNAPNYSTSNFTYLSIYPHYNLPSNERSGMAMPLKYVNLIINGSNYNGIIRITTQIPNGTTSDTYQYIDISKNSDNNFIINYPDSENFLISIDIQATYSNGSYNIPTEIISNVEQVNAVSDYQIGYDTAKSEFGNIIAQNTNAINNLNETIEQNNQTIATLRQRVNDLQEQVNNNFGFQNVFFAMADTPFKTVSNFLGFELFGVNLFQALIGFITVLACVWLIKKFI